ncbi:4-diphosphocytidyl-2-C-methyl-D-erythritol kinase [Psychrobacter arcticus 273-4]|uniref:4-diphosphocytidyl-2-C-methyl-D-erythritol kinase n=1 Tax=Psychrobacter arcticus (strain DSM 17307 / VKM B-2377 / 273-4) TaxID=259536 RepID=ISPE_PSYA2|nr:4-(cytidine 5'-diphospho)-2-C-methyl-D-erythritol kinase [Psychrobacter arcticus]Q4FVB2.1 RecName: Full=4-diphosphocytidyl-2-C-methyl-D-erythritol kinase; Short=CMK; AltName: Full=4-(cytidine-5'-diphospho)-2-C-methyl-D-erythritol kinase [Psychrobacter arcticus 273-4]AAZ18046.1 4-diphosphocytidyl-2-C-methyl-D-erythritol kinase [Psychrobacter arcticus 273-4]
MTKNAPTASVITRLSPAKINLFLHITGKRADGYHNLQTVFRLLDWGDYLHFSVANKPMATIDSAVDNSAVDINSLCGQLLTLDGAEAITSSIEDNLIFKAARTLLAAAIDSSKLPEHLPKVLVTLDKHLPMGAGLGGGSSNAATTLLVLNEIWQLNFNQETLIKIGAKIGADVPIFIFGQDAIATGIGEQLTAIDLPDQQYLVLTPNAHVNTAKLFAHPKLPRDITLLSIETIKNQYDNYVQTLIAPYHNVFTPVVTSLAPAVDEGLRYLQGLEKIALGTARMTGSGSTVFLPLDASVTDDKLLLSKWIEEAPCTAYVVRSL